MSAPELTDSDRAAIAAAWQEYKTIDPRKRYSPEPSEGGVRQHFYLAGKAAGIAACAPIMANLCSYVEQEALHLTGAQEVIDDARAAIRSAAKP